MVTTAAPMHKGAEEMTQPTAEDVREDVVISTKMLASLLADDNPSLNCDTNTKPDTEP